MKTILLDVHVQPRASKDEVVGLHDGRYKLRITASPVDGKANQHLANYLADLFGVGRRHVELVFGESSRIKRFRIQCEGELPKVFTDLASVE